MSKNGSMSGSLLQKREKKKQVETLPKLSMVTRSDDRLNDDC